MHSKQVKRMLKDNWQLDVPNVLTNLKQELNFSPIDSPKKKSFNILRFSYSLASFILLFIIGSITIMQLAPAKSNDKLQDSSDNYPKDPPTNIEDTDFTFPKDIRPNQIIQYEVDGENMQLSDASSDEVIEMLNNLSFKNISSETFASLDSDSLGEKLQVVRIYLELPERNYKIISIRDKFYLLKSEFSQTHYYEVTDDSALKQFLNEKSSDK